MPLGTQVGLSLGDFVFDGDRALPEKGTAPSHYWPMSIVAKRLDRSRCHLVRRKNLGPGEVVLHGVAAPLKGAQPPGFRFMSIVAKRLDG